MFGKCLLVGICAIFMTGCSSNSPSEKDVRKGLEDAFASCSLAKIKDVKRLNGEQGSDVNKYLVDVSFVLNIEPVPNASERSAKAQKIEEESRVRAKNLSDQISSLNTRVEELKGRRREEVDAAQRDISTYRNSDAHLRASVEERFRMSSEIHKKMNESLSRYDDQIKPLSEKLYGLQLSLANSGGESAAMRRSLVEDFSRLCAIRGLFAERVFMEEMARGNINRNKTPLGGSFELHYKIWMKKTDNGWIFNM